MKRIYALMESPQLWAFLTGANMISLLTAIKFGGALATVACIVALVASTAQWVVHK